MLQIRWHGRGGQGAITAAKIFATAAFKAGYTGVVMAPTFGTERRGAPVFTSLKLAKEKIYDISPIEAPDVVVVLDHLLLTEADVTGGLKLGGLIVLNTPKPAADYDFAGMRLATADVTSLAVEAGLPRGVVNSGIIGSVCKALDLVPFDLVLAEIEAEFVAKKPQANAAAAKLAYKKTVVGEAQGASAGSGAGARPAKGGSS
jgi:2-oxoacid:acceptor oxidoreductase gamma subunit (pyruvate/2-ketoisovalerate family)